MFQPLLASATRAVEKLRDIGEPLPDELTGQLAKLVDDTQSDVVKSGKVEELLRPYVLAEVVIDEQGLTAATPGAAAPRLVQHGWRSFLVRVVNPHRLLGDLSAPSNSVLGLVDYQSHAGRITLADTLTVVPRIERSWLEVKLAGPTDVAGVDAEYKVISLYSRDGGTQSGELTFLLAVEEATESLTRSPVSKAWKRTVFESRQFAAKFDFDCLPARDIRFDIREPDGSSTVAALTVLDSQRRAYPSKAMRLAPDMFFHEHVYRATGEVIALPAGEYEISARRGPEYREVRVEVELSAESEAVSIELDRWADPAARGYYSGDPHIHAGGCSHYSVPSEGVTPETMIRHVRGEGLWMGSVLTWGPCYYHQKQFFSGVSISPRAELEYPAMQQAQGMTWDPQDTDRDRESLLRYDLEVSGFPSSHSGHVILLGLTDQDYPGTSVIEDWPSWNLPVMRWGHEQNALVGYAHCGLGLSVETDELPNYVIPGFQSIGSNEIIVDVPLGAADFQCGAEFSPAAELNIWYHLLSVGYRTLMLGETDYPCIYDDGPGVGRTYVRLAEAPAGEQALEAWLGGLKDGASYFGDGRSHVYDFAVDGDVSREHSVDAPGPVRVSATVAAWLPEEPPELPAAGQPVYSAPVGWHLERSRIGRSRTVLVEVLVNGVSVGSQELLADGNEQAVEFSVELERSSWVALRILRSVHTQPIFVEIGGLPIRASRRSAQWLHDSVDALWKAKSGFIREDERSAAREAYDAAQAIYLVRLGECEVD
ncbi:CehA/McbA family metallohydrolase [Kribbella sp. NPDC051718]|uniref:CehA/McbA family metallohydrolase n=1 Tax=Kribbella sp. NPDC051718 TaxID=3155168 RepID=UPI003439CE30